MVVRTDSLQAQSAKGEVAGAFLLGLVQSFYNLSILPQGGLALDVEQLSPTEWYPYTKLMDALQSISKTFASSEHLFFRAGIHFLRIWYEHGPGKTMIHSGMDWLHANDSSGGYNSVVRGGSKETIGWCLMQSLDEEQGIAVYENVMPLSLEFVKGIFYGGCILFEDFEYVDVSGVSEPYPANAAFNKFYITVRFRKKAMRPGPSLDQRIDALGFGANLDLTADEIQSLVWRYKDLKLSNTLNGHYYGDINVILSNAVAEGQRISKELEVSKLAAEAANQSKSSFLANMSHEIRTPMNAILGLLDLLQSTELTDRQRDYATKTDGAARSLLGLLNDILDFSKVEAGKMTLESEPFRIDKLLRNLSTILSSNVGSKDIEVLFDIDATLPAVVRGDAMRLQQVLINLGGNAVKFTSQGQVVLAMHTLSHQANSVSIQFSVQDTGIGIAPEHQAHIFSGFSQAEGSTTRRFGGTGLGLAISKRFVELMGGDIEITSAPGVGSTFAFALEMPTVETDSDASNEPHRPVITPQRVLVVDDNPIAGELTLRMVRSWGWTADLAKSAKQAIEMVAAQEATGDGGFPYPVIYMDWKMPDMDGWEVTRRIREMAKVGDMHQPLVVMITAHGRETLALRTEVEQEMINGFLVKPVTASMLYDALMDANSGNTPIRKLAKGRNSARQLIGMRILVVEDNLINQQVADELLTAQGAIVSLAANGQLGVDAVAAAAPQFDVVLMDVQMPVLDGYGATRVIRNELGRTDLPIIAMTANAMASDRDACIAAGMNEHIGKPFDMAKLVSLLIRTTGLQLTHASIEESVTASSEVQNAHEIEGLELQTALNRMSGMRSLYVRTARDFISAMDTIIPEIQQYLAAGDKQKTIMRLHTLKGNAGTLGATELAAKASELEKICATGAGMQECDEGLGRFDILVRSTQKILNAAIALLESPPAGGNPIAEPSANQPVSEAAIGALRRIADMAKASDMEALQEFAQTRELLAELPVESMDALDLALQDLDLDLAGTLSDEMLSRLNR
jgi:two-component system sensor histidine kinase/response regulator